MAYFLQLGKPGKDQIVGKSRVNHHMGWIELMVFSRPSRQADSGYRSERGMSLDDYICTRTSGDSVTTVLAAAAANGRRFESAILSITAPQGHWVSRIVLERVIVTSFGFSAAVDPKPYEVFSLVSVRDR